MSDLLRESASIMSYLAISLGRCLSDSKLALNKAHGKLLGQPTNTHSAGPSKLNRRTFLIGAGLQWRVIRISLVL